jgi:hypothetical protein
LSGQTFCLFSARARSTLCWDKLTIIFDPNNALVARLPTTHPEFGARSGVFADIPQRFFQKSA